MSKAFLYSAVYDNIFEVIGNAIVPQGCSDQSHDNGTVCVSVITLKKYFDQGVNKAEFFLVDLIYGQLKGYSDVVHVQPCHLYISDELTHFPHFDQLFWPVTVDPPGSLINSKLVVIVFQNFSQDLAVYHANFGDELVGCEEFDLLSDQLDELIVT